MFGQQLPRVRRRRGVFQKSVQQLVQRQRVLPERHSRAVRRDDGGRVVHVSALTLGLGGTEQDFAAVVRSDGVRLLQGQNGIGTADRERDMDGVGRHGPDHQEVRSLVYRQREYRTAAYAASWYSPTFRRRVPKSSGLRVVEKSYQNNPMTADIGNDYGCFRKGNRRCGVEYPDVLSTRRPVYSLRSIRLPVFSLNVFTLASFFFFIIVVPVKTLFRSIRPCLLHMD